MRLLARQIPPQEFKPSRKAGVRGYIGLTKAAEAVCYESSLERDWLMFLDCHSDVVRIATQPIEFEFQFEGMDKPRHYTPDVICERRGGGSLSTTIYEVKSRGLLKIEWPTYRLKFRAAQRYCWQRGWRFQLVTESLIHSPAVQNRCFLHKYRNVARSEDIALALMTQATHAPGIAAWDLICRIYKTQQSQALAITQLWHLLAIGKFLTSNVNLLDIKSSPIWVNGENT